ncbi:MAG TPA: CapA family protein, partial [Ilumatobacteraceae bacterium]|nr:CapA family protein [Ilumatobacteraceae bacterium]
EEVGLRGVGGGATTADAAEPLVIDVAGVRVGITAFDVSGGAPATAVTAGVNRWDAGHAREAVTALRSKVDVVVVGLHAGVEYLPRPDPSLAHIVGLLADWGTDIVWGHGAHVQYPVEVRLAAERSSVMAAGLGNTLFDQRWPRTREGTVLEVLIDHDGVIAMRTGVVRSDAGRAVFEGWDEPVGDAVAIDGDWWAPVRPWVAAGVESADVAGIEPSLPAASVEVVRAVGDVTGTGEVDVVTAYRRPATPRPVHAAFPEVSWIDGDGRSAHLAVYTGTGRLRWGAGALFRPVGGIAVCTGSMALGFTTLDDPATVAGGAWTWDGFGFRTAPVLPGPATPACADVDHDGRSDPVLTARTGGPAMTDISE